MFDRRGHRIGYGAGYYDLTLTALRARKPITALGIAYAVQEIDAGHNIAGDNPVAFVAAVRSFLEVTHAHERH